MLLRSGNDESRSHGIHGAAIAVDPTLAMNSYFVPQGISADILATKYGFSRDDVDAFAVESQKSYWQGNQDISKSQLRQ